VPPPVYEKTWVDHAAIILMIGAVIVLFSYGLISAFM
jgi:hypothetical protein